MKRMAFLFPCMLWLLFLSYRFAEESADISSEASVFWEPGSDGAGLERAGAEAEEDERSEEQNEEKNEEQNEERNGGRNDEDTREIALTFDDGPHPVYTERLLDGLKERGVRATFFVTGANVSRYPQLVKRMYDEGHLIGNHTYHHVQMTSVGDTRFRQEIISTNEAIRAVTGADTEYIRPPYGAWNKRYEEELNMIPVLWTVDPRDWCSDDADCVVQSVLSLARDDDIILLHDQYASSVEAALRIVDALREEGYVFVTVEELLLD